MGNKRKEYQSSSLSHKNGTNANPNKYQIKSINFIYKYASDHPGKFIAISLIVSIILAFSTTFGLSMTIQFSEQKHIAQGISDEINLLYPLLQEQSNLYVELQQKGVIAPVQNDPVYTKDGLYYVYGKDIYKLNQKLSYKLFDFYSNITRAEYIRSELIQNCINVRENPNIVVCNYTYYNDERAQMHERILHATNDVESIRPLLNETIDNPLAIF